MTCLEHSQYVSAPRWWPGPWAKRGALSNINMDLLIGLQSNHHKSQDLHRRPFCFTLERCADQKYRGHRHTTASESLARRSFQPRASFIQLLVLPVGSKLCEHHRVEIPMSTADCNALLSTYIWEHVLDWSRRALDGSEHTVQILPGLFLDDIL